MAELREEVLWSWACGCGAVSDAPNDADVCVNKVKTHVLAFHVGTGADIVISGVVTHRRTDELSTRGREQTSLDAGAQRQAALERLTRAERSRQSVNVALLGAHVPPRDGDEPTAAIDAHVADSPA